MNPAQDTLWRELEPLLDDAMLTLSERQRELVLAHYFQNNSQRAAAGLVGCSESVASRELAAAIESLRRFFSRQGVTVAGTALVTLLTTNGAHASIGTATVAATLSSASALAGTSAVGTSLFLALMKTTTTTKIIVAAVAALLITSGTVHYFTREDVQTARRKAEDQPAPAVARADKSQSTSDVARTPATTARLSPATLRPSALSAEAKAPVPVYDEAALKAAREKLGKFTQRIGQLALMTDSLKVQETLLSEYGIRLSVDEIRTLQERGPKGFSFGVIDLWASRQPQEALAWVASTHSEQSRGGVDFHQLFLDAARRSMPNLSRDTLNGLLPDGPSKNKLLDLAEANTDPYLLANRILAVTDPTERASRLGILAQGWSNSESSAEWARQNLSGADKTAFYSQVGYNLAEQNPQAALQVLAELKGTDAYASTFGLMIRGLAQVNDQGQQAARKLGAEGTAILYTTHYLEEAETLCSRIGIIDHGKLLAEGTLSELQKRLGGDQLFVLEGNLQQANPDDWPGFRERFRIIQKSDHQLVVSAQNSRHPSECLRDLLELPVRVENVTLKRPSLNDVFLQLTGRELRE